MSLCLVEGLENSSRPPISIRRSPVRPGSVAYWVLRFFDRRDLFEFKLVLMGLLMLLSGGQW